MIPLSRSFACFSAAASLLFSATVCVAQMGYPLVIDEPFTVRVLSGNDGKPVAHVHLIIIGGYDLDDIAHHLWEEETLTDDDGEAQITRPLASLPFVQVWVTKRHLCQGNPRASKFSIDRIRNYGLAAPNRCGISTAEDTPGVFTVFVKGKPVPPPPAADADSDAEPAAEVVPASLPAPPPAPAAIVPGPKLPPSPAPAPGVRVIAWHRRTLKQP